MHTHARLLVALVGLAAAPAALAQQLAVTSTVPALNAINAPRTTPISVTFDRPVNPATFTPQSFGAFAKWSGPVAGALTFSNGDRTVTLTPIRPFAAGEGVMVGMSNALRAADGSAIRQGGYTLTFMTAVAPTAGAFVERGRFSSRTSPSVQTRIYGGLACDLNRDGWADLTLVNEVSADLRVFLNRVDGSALFGPLLQPTTPIPFESSPNEPADFNGDGLVDIVTSSNAADQIAILFGNGNGTWQPATNLNVGDFPRGFGILDAEGDGDLDIAVAVRGLDAVRVLYNNGSGGFSIANSQTFPTGGDGPYGMTAADMNNDGLLDLVVGHDQSQQVAVLRGNGNGTFTAVSIRPVGGQNWVVYAADLNNDGNMDVSAANSFSNNASILLGNGDGTLQAATTVNIGGHTVATDLADIDGDGDIDWIVSSFGAGRWKLYRNNGQGQMTFERDFIAPNNPACCLPADLDNDGDVELVLLDEIADVVIVMGNGEATCYANCDRSTGSPALSPADFVCFLDRFRIGDPYTNCDGSTGVPLLSPADFVCFLNRFRGGCP